jgi:subtilase family serine protease
MRRVVFGLLSFAIAGAAAPGANAQAIPLDRFGNVFHKPVCGQVVGRVARCHAHIVTDASGRPVANARSAAGTPSGYGPGDLRGAYRIAATGSSSTIVAIVDAYGYTNAEKDLAAYRAQYGLPACTTANGCFKKLNQDGVQGSYPAQNTGWAQESALDLDMASTMCPNCRLYLVEANSSSFSNLIVAENTAVVLGAHAISNSYGAPESGTATLEKAYNHPGVAITASTGDNGYEVQFPASSPHVTAVGGTNLKRASNSRGWTESVWSGAGSGCSTIYAKPSWQQDTGCLKRTVADVSAVADPNTAVAVYGPTSTGSAWLLFGGTSVAAPLIAGIFGANGGAVRYGYTPYAHLSSLFDVRIGSNGSCGGSYLCTGTRGYDGPSGLGSPNGSAAF